MGEWSPAFQGDKKEYSFEESLARYMELFPEVSEFVATMVVAISHGEEELVDTIE